jgi:hypothetical protein
LPVKGIEIVGRIPDEVQYLAVFSAALVTGSTEPDASRRSPDDFSNSGRSLP